MLAADAASARTLCFTAGARMMSLKVLSARTSASSFATGVPPPSPSRCRTCCSTLYRDVSRTSGGVVRKRSNCLHGGPCRQH